MLEISPAAPQDLAWLAQQEHHITAQMLHRKVEAGELLLARLDVEPIGWLRWGYFWDSIPFMNHLFVLSAHRGVSVGKQLVTMWEQQMHRSGHTSVMTSSLSDESAQHFYRRLGYVDRGALLLPGEALEIIFMKDL